MLLRTMIENYLLKYNVIETEDQQIFCYSIFYDEYASELFKRRDKSFFIF